MATYVEHPSTLTRVRIGLALGVAGVVLAGCGGSSKTASTGAGTTSAAPSAATSSTAPASKAASGSGSSSTNLGGGSFCDKAKSVSAQVMSSAEDLATGTPDKIKAFEQNALNELKALQGQAPDEIKGSISTLVNAEQTLFNDLQAVNFDFSKVGTQIATQFSSPQFTQATTQIDNYLESKCGINPSADPTP
jgi:hypothetical protein